MCSWRPLIFDSCCALGWSQ